MDRATYIFLYCPKRKLNKGIRLQALMSIEPWFVSVVVITDTDKTFLLI